MTPPGATAAGSTGRPPAFYWPEGFNVGAVDPPPGVVP